MGLVFLLFLRPLLLLLLTLLLLFLFLVFLLLFLFQPLLLLLVSLFELLELLLLSLFHLRVDVVRPAVVIWPRRRRAIIVSPRIARPAEINWSVATVASGISRVGWRIHGLVRRIPRNGIVHRGRAIVVVSI